MNSVLQLYRPSRVTVLILIGLWSFSALLVNGTVRISEKGIAFALLFTLLTLMPGYLTIRILRIGVNWSYAQLCVLAMGIGLTEGLVLGSIAIVLGSPTPVLAWAILIVAFAKIVWIVLHGWGCLTTPVSFEIPQLIQMSFVFVLLVILIRNLHNAQIYTWSPSDSWNYAQVQAQFSANPGHLNLQPGITALSVNHRLIWNSWLYNQAMMVDIIRDSDPIAVGQRDGLYICYVFAMIACVALARELFQDRQVAWLAAFLQIGFILAGAGSLFTERIIEDKFFSFFVFIPLVYMVLLRYIRQPSRKMLLLFLFLTIGMTLIHPVNPVMLFLTATPFVFYHCLVQRNRRAFIEAFPIIISMGILLAYPILMQITLAREVLYTGPLPAIDDALEQSRNVPWTYITKDFWVHTFYRLDFISAYIITLSVVFIASVRNRHDITLNFIFGVSTAIALFLWIPPFAAMGARIMTTSQNWRIFMLFPAGYCWSWLLVEIGQWMRTRLGRRTSFNDTVVRIIWGGGSLAALFLIWHWRAVIPIKTTQDGLTDLERTAFEVNRETVGTGRVLAGSRLSRAIPTFWPDANTPFSGKLMTVSPKEAEKLKSVIESPSDLLVNEAINENAIQYILLLHTNQLATMMAIEWPCCVILYENREVILYEVRYDIPLSAVTLDEIQNREEYLFGDFALLQGYSLQRDKNSIQVMLYWKPLSQTKVPYTVFVHLYSEGDDNSPPLRQDDHPPRLNQTPTTTWVPNSVIRDAYKLNISNIPDGNYTIAIGLWNPFTGERLPISDGHGTVIGDKLALTAVQVSTDLE